MAVGVVQLDHSTNNLFLRVGFFVAIEMVSEAFQEWFQEQLYREQYGSAMPRRD